MPGPASTRPPVAVVLPFHGDAAEADAALARLAGLAVGPDDEVVLADNTDGHVAVGRPRAPHVEVIACEVPRSAYAARNIGAERTRAPWILYVDADCHLPPDLLDAYFDSAPGDRDGALAGVIAGLADQPGLAPRYARARRHLDQQWVLEQHPYRPMAVTANLLVRRAAWGEVGGFHEQTVSGADADFCWRLQDAGWRLAYRPGARVEHEHRATVGALLAKARRDGAGHRWLSRRHPGLRATIPARRLGRVLGGIAVWTLRGRPSRALYNAIDAAWILAWNLGTLHGNRPPSAITPSASVILMDEFPRPGTALPAGARVEAIRRPTRPDWSAGRKLPATLIEDDSPLWGQILQSSKSHGNARMQDLTPGVWWRLAPAARRLARDEPGVRVLAEPALLRDAERLAALAGRRDAEIRPLD